MKNDKGVTLIELILSMALIGIIAVSVFTVFNASLINIVRAGKRTEAVNLAEERFDDNPTIIVEKSIIIDIPSPAGTKTHTIKGSEAKGSVQIHEGPVPNIEVEINAFIPGLFVTE